MRGVTIISMGVSVTLGLGALFMAKVALPAGGLGQAAAAPAARPIANAVSVVVAARDIPYGARLEVGHLRLIRLSADVVPAGAFSSIEAVLTQDSGGAPVALMAMTAREPILPAKLSGPGARPSVAAELAPDMRAYAIRVSDVTGVGGHALPGDRVDVVLMRNMGADDQHKVLQSELVIQNARVLGVDLNSDPTSNKPETPETATLEVSVKEAQKLAVAADLGLLSLALRRSGDTRIEAVAPLSGRDLAARPGGGVAARPGPLRRLRPGPAPVSKIIVVEGEGAARAAAAGV